MKLSIIEQEIPEVQLEEFLSKLDAKDFACRSYAKAKPQRREPAGSSPRTVPIERRTWTDVEPGKYLFSDYAVSKKFIHLLRHGQHVHREDDGAVQFWRMKEILQKYFPYCPHWSDSKWKTSMAGWAHSRRSRRCAPWCAAGPVPAAGARREPRAAPLRCLRQTTRRAPLPRLLWTSVSVELCSQLPRPCPSSVPVGRRTFHQPPPCRSCGGRLRTGPFRRSAAHVATMSVAVCAAVRRRVRHAASWQPPGSTTWSQQKRNTNLFEPVVVVCCCVLWVVGCGLWVVLWCVVVLLWCVVVLLWCC